MEHLDKAREVDCGRNVALTIHLIRHGQKNQEGRLTRGGRYAARTFGAQFDNEADMVRVYTGSLRRVRKTGIALARGADTIFNRPRRVEELSLDSLFFDSGRSQLLERVDRRLRSIASLPGEEYLSARAGVERRNLQDWFSFGDQRPDEGTASSYEVASDMVALIKNQISIAKALKSNIHAHFFDVTHEFMIAAFIGHCLYREGEDGQREQGLALIASMGGIAPLEDLQIVVKTDHEGESEVRIQLRGEPYGFDFEKFEDLTEGGGEVLEGLSDVFTVSKGRHSIAETVVSNLSTGECQRLFVLGQPGTGKTTVVNQLRRRLEAGGIEVDVVLYDNLLAQTVAAVGKSDDEWGALERNRFVDTIRQALLARRPGAIQLVELPSFGEKERGQTAIEQLPLEERDASSGIWLVQNLELQARAARLRNALVRESRFLPNRRIEHVLRSQYNIRIVGWPPDISSRERGMRIRSVLAKTAMPEDIEQISGEIIREAIKQKKEGVLSQFQWEPENIPPDLLDALQRARSDLEYIMHQIVVRDFPEMTIAFNPAIYDRPITWHARMFLD